MSPQDFEEILYDTLEGAAFITINLPRVLNAFRAQTVEEMIAAFARAGANKQIGVIVLTGACNAFCTGGGQSDHDGSYGGRGATGIPADKTGIPVVKLQSLICDVPQPVIAGLCNRW